MTVILNESDAQLDALAGQRVAVVGYGNQGRSWALNLRDSGLDVVVCVRADPTRDTAVADGFAASDLEGRMRPTSSACSSPMTSSPACPWPLASMRSSSWPAATPWPSAGSTRRATPAWWRPACSGPRSGAVTRRASASSRRWGCRATSPARPGPGSWPWPRPSEGSAKEPSR